MAESDQEIVKPSSDAGAEAATLAEFTNASHLMPDTHSLRPPPSTIRYTRR